LSPDLDLKEVIFRARPRKPLILRDRLECGLCAERERERERVDMGEIVKFLNGTVWLTVINT